MAESTSTSKLVLTFGTAEGDEVNFSYSHADPAAEMADIKALTEALITNGSIFEKVPTAYKAAKIVTTTTTELDFDESE